MDARRRFGSASLRAWETLRDLNWLTMGSFLPLYFSCPVFLSGFRVRGRNGARDLGGDEPPGTALGLAWIAERRRWGKCEPSQALRQPGRQACGGTKGLGWGPAGGAKTVSLFLSYQSICFFTYAALTG
jgi:hypothetical protein